MPDEEATAQVWELRVGGRVHRVETSGSWSRRLRWYVDQQLVAERRTTDEKVRLTVRGRPDLGAVGVRFSRLGKPRRATLFEAGTGEGPDAATRAVTGAGGLDLEPEPGSPAALHEDRVRARPRSYALVAALGGVASVVLPLLLTALLARVAFSLPWPEWNLPLPNLPAVPLPDRPDLPDLPDVPWPDWSLPGWMLWVVDNVHFVWPVVLACVLAHREIRRRAAQDELRAARARGRAEAAGDPE